MREDLSEAVEDYLKAIFNLQQGSERVSTSDLAEHMGVTAASVTGMLQRLAAMDPPLVTYQKHHGVSLTHQGEQAALEVIRHHRLLELFLQETLGYAWDQVHAEADRLEHVISEDLEERIAESLGNPVLDPHGEPIPSRDLHLVSSSAIPLSDLRAGQTGKVERVDASDVGLLRYLAEIGLVPGVEVKIVHFSLFDGNLSLVINSQPNSTVLGPGVTSRVFMQVPTEAE